MTRTWPVAGVLFGALWVFVRGPSLAIDAVVGQFLFGIAVGLPVAFVFRRLYDETFTLRRSVRAVPAALLFLAAFAREIVVATFDVTYRVFAPSLPIEPEVILIPLRVQTDLGVTTIANSITITPGTLTLDYDPEQNALYVHVIDGRDPEGVVEPIRRWENYALVVFEEERSPGDPAPDFAVYPPDETHPVLEGAAGDLEDEDGREKREADAPPTRGENGGS